MRNGNAFDNGRGDPDGTELNRIMVEEDCTNWQSWQKESQGLEQESPRSTTDDEGEHGDGKTLNAAPMASMTSHPMSIKRGARTGRLMQWHQLSVEEEDPDHHHRDCQDDRYQHCVVI